MSTDAEYLPRSASKDLHNVVEDEDGMGSAGDKGTTWASETYENSLKVDQVFERFSKRVGAEGEQCVR